MIQYVVMKIYVKFKSCIEKKKKRTGQIQVQDVKDNASENCKLSANNNKHHFKLNLRVIIWFLIVHACL